MLAAALLLASASPACQATAAQARAAASTFHLPAFASYVVDDAHLLPAPAKRAMTEELGRVQRRTGRQMAVVTVTGLGGRSVEDYTRTLANVWGVGRRGVNDGVVLLVAPCERRVRIEVGRGLEATLTNAEAQAIVDRRILPALRTGDYARGVQAGVDGVLRAIAPGVR